MRYAIPFIALLLACDFHAKVSITSVPPDAAASPLDDKILDQFEAAPVLIIPPKKIVSKRVSRRVLVVGDSEACRVGYYLKDAVEAINDENHEPRDLVYVSCKGATVIQYWGAGGHMAQALREFQDPDDVIVFLGTNHYWQKVTPPTYMVTNLLGNSTCIWVGNTAVHGQHWPINRLIRDAVSPECQYFDTESADIPLEDGVHPGRAGAVKWLRLVWATIPAKFEDSHDNATQ